MKQHRIDPKNSPHPPPAEEQQPQAIPPPEPAALPIGPRVAGKGICWLDWRGSLLGALLGIVSFFTIMGYTPLIGSNIGWISGGDPALYYLSAAFFQESPWSFPPGLNPHYGLEIPSAIIYGDPITLLAFFFKFLHSITGHTIQYMGLWILICFTLQGLFGWLLAGRFTSSNTIKLCTALLVLFTPVFLAPTLQLAAYPISGQFLLLASLLLFFSPVNRNRRLLWTVLTAVAALCNVYNFAMVVVVWLADVAARAWKAEQQRRSLGIEMVQVVSVIFLALWLAGFFVMGSGFDTGGFGVYRANLLSMFDSKPGHLSFSYFLPPTPRVSPVDNAPNFLGTGIIFLLAAAGLVCLERELKPCWKNRVWPLIVAAALMVLFSLSNKISIGAFEVAIPINGLISRVANLFSVSARFMWPALYLSVLGAVYILTKYLDRKTAYMLFLFAAGLQVIDTRAGWGGTEQYVSAHRSTVWKTAFTSPFWERAGHIYKDVRSLPLANRKAGYEGIAYFALKHAMRTDAVYLARIDQVRLNTENARFVRDLAEGKLDPKTLYILDDKDFEIAWKGIRPGDLLDKIDGVLVLAPRWDIVSGCRGAGASSLPGECPVSLKPGQPLPLNGLNWQPWGPGHPDPVRLEVSSDTLVDSSLVGSLVLPQGPYLISACMSWDVEGPPSGAAHFSLFGQRKLIEIQTSRQEGACRLARLDVPSGGNPVRFSFGLGGWSTGKGRIRLDRLIIQPLVPAN